MKAKSITTNAELHRLRRGEILLIRAGQHLFKLWRKTGRSDEVLAAAFQEIFAAKVLLRADLARLNDLEKPRHKANREQRKANKNASAAA